MTPELRRMAEEAGILAKGLECLNYGFAVVDGNSPGPALEAFARLVAEDAAKICEAHSDGELRRFEGADCAKLIRPKYALTEGGGRG